VTRGEGGRLVISAALSGLMAATAQCAFSPASASTDRYGFNDDSGPWPASVAVSPKVRQLITVTSRDWNDTWAHLRFWHRKPG
jgi:hypothetical protein